MRLVSCAALIAAAACSSKSTSPDGDGATEPDPKGWTITIDMSSLDRFVQPADTPSWPITGVATASEGFATVAVNGALVEVDSKGAFAATSSVMPGLTPVSVLATDDAGHTRKGDRTLLAARFLPDDSYNRSAANLVVTNAVLAAMNDSIASYATGVDIAGEILARNVLSQDDRCVTWPIQGNQGTPTATLVNDQGELWLRIRVPNLYIYFEGSCRGLLGMIPIAGAMRGTIDVWTQLIPKPSPTGACLTAFAHSQPEVSITGWAFDVWGTSGPLQAWIVEMFSGSKATEARTQLAREVGTRADELLETKLHNVSVFDRSSQLELLGRPITLDLCVADLETTNGTLRALVAARAAGNGELAAPGAPQLDGGLVRAAASELALDANLIAQLLFASWRDGGLVRSAPDIDAGVLQILMPGLASEFPDATTAQVAINAELPPYVRALPAGPGDLAIELGDLQITVTIEDKPVLRFGTVLTLHLELTPMNGALVPSVVDTTAKVALLDERYDGSDDALEQAVQVQIGSAASKLLGAGAAIALPALPGLGAPVDVTPDSSGRFLRVKLAP